MENLDQIPEEIQLLISDFLTGLISDQDLDHLYHWISEDENHLRLFNSYKTTWILCNKSDNLPEEKIKTDLDKIKQKLEMKSVKKKIPNWSLLKIAASWLFFLLIGGAISAYLTVQLHENVSLNTTISAPLGSRSLVNLPDGSIVWLNAGSKITYNTLYGKSTREVQLTGEAYFHVKSNKKVPFLVKTSDIIVKALGTKFNVKAYPEEKTITATLEEGKIVIIPCGNKTTKEAIELKPNEMAIFYKQKEKINDSKQKISQAESSAKPEKNIIVNINSNIKTELATSWKDNTWIIEGQSFETLAPQLERRYNIQIEFSSDDIKNYKFSGRIQKETIEQIMSALELSAPIQYKIERNKIILSINKLRQEQYNQFTGH